MRKQFTKLATPESGQTGRSQKILVMVTQEHIENGEQEDGASCPVALGFEASFSDDVRPAIMTADDCVPKLYNHTTGEVLDVPLSDDILLKIAEFDDNEDMVPFTFTATVPDYWRVHPLNRVAYHEVPICHGTS